MSSNENGDPLPDVKASPKPKASTNESALKTPESPAPKTDSSEPVEEEPSPDKFSLPPIKHQSAVKGKAGEKSIPPVFKPTATHASPQRSPSPLKPSLTNSPVQPFQSGSFSPYQAQQKDSDAVGGSASNCSKMSAKVDTKTASTDGAFNSKADTATSRANSDSAPANKLTGATDSKMSAGSDETGRATTKPTATIVPASPQNTGATTTKLPAKSDETGIDSTKENDSKSASSPTRTPAKRKKRVAAKSVLTGKVAPDSPMRNKLIPPKKKQKLSHSSSKATTKEGKGKKKKKSVAHKSVLEDLSSKKKKKTTAEKEAKATTNATKTPFGKTKAKEIDCAKPTETLPDGLTWPPGWKRRIFERVSGATKGDTDKYWYSPETNKKFRSLVQVSRFLKLLKNTGGDEQKAWKAMR